MRQDLPGQIEFLQSVVDTARDPILVLDAALQVVSANRAFYRTFQVNPDETENRLIYELGARQWDIPALRVLLEEILPQNSSFDDFEVTHDFPCIGRKIMMLNARKLYRPGNHTEMLLLAFEDVTKRRDAEIAAQEALARLQAAYDREHKIAVTLQKPLSLEVREDGFEGVSIASIYEPGNAEAEIGGDFFDVFALPRNLLVCAVGDVSGKGLIAAARAMQVKDVLRAFAREYPHSAAHIIARLNDYVYQTMLNETQEGLDDTEGGMPAGFVCLAVVILNPQTGEATAISAGLEPPSILRADGSTEIISINGVPLGVMEQTLYAAVPMQLNLGDTLILLTDGVTEARNRQRQFLDLEGVLALAQQAQGASTLRETGRQILAGAKEFADGVLRDDACLLLVKKS